MFSAYSNFGILLMAGKGSRFDKNTPKQYLPFKGIPLFLYAYKAMALSPRIDAIICVIGKNEEGLAKDFIKDIIPSKPTYFVIGGDSRNASVHHAIDYLLANSASRESLVMIQDAARPYLEEAYIEESLNKAKKAGAAIVCHPSSDSVALGNGEKLTSYLDRREVYIIATPQTFVLDTIARAYERGEGEAYTDDGSFILATLGIKPEIVLGKSGNIKITFPSDAD